MLGVGATTGRLCSDVCGSDTQGMNTQVYIVEQCQKAPRCVLKIGSVPTPSNQLSISKLDVHFHRRSLRSCPSDRRCTYGPSRFPRLEGGVLAQVKQMRNEFFKSKKERPQLKNLDITMPACASVRLGGNAAH